MAVQRQDVDVDNRVDFAGAMVGPPSTVGELRIILEDFKDGEPNEWLDIEQARKTISNLYWLLFNGKKNPDFEDWDKIIEELGKELDRQREEGEDWETKPLPEIDSEVAKAWEEAINEPDLSAKVPTAILRELLEKMDDANARRDIGAEATRLESIYGRYLKRQTIEEVLKAKIAYQRREEDELKRQRPEASAEKIRELADKRTDAQIVAEEKLLHEANRSPEEAKILAQEIARAVVEPEVRRAEVMARFEGRPEEVVAVVEDMAVTEEIRERLGEQATPEMFKLARETERDLRNALGETAVEVTVAVINGTKPEEAIPEDIKIEKRERERVVNELEITEKIRDTEAVIKQKEDVITAELIKILGIEGDEIAVNEIRQKVGERIRLVLKDGGDLNRTIITPVVGAGEIVAPMRMTDEVDKVVGAEVPAGQRGDVLSVLEQADGELRQYQNQFKKILDWRERFIKRNVYDVVVVANPGVNVAVAEEFAGEVAKVYGPNSGVLEVERQTWREANLAGQITSLQEAELMAFTDFVRSKIPIADRLAAYEAGQRELDANGSVEAQGYQAVLGEANGNPGLAEMMERARLAGGNFVQNFAIQQLGKIKGLEGFAKFLGGPTNNMGIGFAKEAIGLLKNSKSFAGGLKAILGLAGGGGGAAGAAGTGRVLLGLAAKLGLGATGPVGWVVGLAGGILGKMGLKAGLKGLIKRAPALLGKAGILGANFAAGLMGAVSTAMAGLSISSVAIWGPIVGILVFVLIIIGPLISAMVPPGRGVGGAVVDQTTLNGGYLAAPVWNGDINDLPDSCPPDSLPIGGIVTQGPDAIGCSHSGYKNVIDVAGPEVDIVATHDGIVETVVNMGSDYGQFVDVRAKCNGVAFVTRYAHLVVGSPQVTTGQKITAGTIIGTRDSSGNSTGTHLHYEIRGLATDYFSNWKGCCITNGIACQN